MSTDEALIEAIALQLANGHLDIPCRLRTIDDDVLRRFLDGCNPTLQVNVEIPATETKGAEPMPSNSLKVMQLEMARQQKSIEQISPPRSKSPDDGDFPPWLWRLTNVTTLVLNNYTFNTLPNKIRQLKSLEALHAYSSHVVSLPRTLSECTRLRVLDMYTSYGLHVGSVFLFVLLFTLNQRVSSHSTHTHQHTMFF